MTIRIGGKPLQDIESTQTCVLGDGPSNPKVIVHVLGSDEHEAGSIEYGFPPDTFIADLQFGKIPVASGLAVYWAIG